MTAGEGAPGPFLLSAERIREARSAVEAEDAVLLAEWSAFHALAERIVDSGRVYSVTFNDGAAASGNPHDYYSTGPYWWPNPETADGLPYIRRDGEFNPERDRVSDRDNLHRMVREVRLLAVAWAISGDLRFSDHAARLVRVWFLDPKTHMRPNLNHAQAIPGRVTGRGTGIIDSHVFIHLVDALSLLEASESWRLADAVAMRAWVGAFLDWLLVHPHGHHERQAANNHGTAYDFQVVSLALYTGRMDLARIVLEEQTRARINAQITAEGRQPLEIARTRSWSYSTENLRHFFWLGRLGQHAGVDLFHYTSPKEASMKGALEFLLPYACEPTAWPYEQVTTWSLDYLREVLVIARFAYPALTLPIDEAMECLSDDLPDETRFFLRLL